ncbi:DUF3231 family protein [Oceanobacillus halophilus]|uniref:DUF3231 family protein n=1 Tax=Oceanobacillus halophilus TaxID=930130 RepID=A0A494ZZ79_9BACI|nr:DUF3231 family protein [Oceanobacillus halophilus]RKQ30395.1 DUF3231 family protein [Oceanobacillus halophilus]
MSEEISYHDNTSLTATEMGKLWVTYIGNSMGKCVLTYYLKNVDDLEIKSVLNDALTLSEDILHRIKEIFHQSNFPVPKGLTTEEDVNLDAPRLFADEFYLYYLGYTGRAGMSLYNAGIPIITRKDIRDFLAETLQRTVELISSVNEVLKSKGIFYGGPDIPTPKKIDFIKSQSYLNGFFGDKRPLHGLEIGHLYDDINNDTTSKALIVAFKQVVQDQKIKRYFERGKNINHRHITTATEMLYKDNLPAPPLLDQMVTDSTIPPFSDKLMLFHKMDMFSMKIRSYANGASLNGRRDIGAMYARFIMDVTLYVEDGANIMIDNGWMEQPPSALDRG